MENLMKQLRVKFSGAEPENKAHPSGSRDQKIPIQKTKSFKEKKKTQNWLQRQFLRKMSRDYDSRDLEHATAVAAAAFAISSQEVEAPETSLTKTKSKGDGTKYPISQPGGSKRFSGSFRSKDRQVKKEPTSPAKDENKPEKTITPVPSQRKTSTLREHLKKEPDTIAPGPKIPPPIQSEPLRSPSSPPISQSSPELATGETKADSWEKAELEKIRKRYEKLKDTIDSWESKKTKKARRKLNMQESELEERRLKALEKFRSEMQYIGQIAGGARAQAEDRQRNEELKAKETANIIRSGGRLPGVCSCF